MNDNYIFELQQNKSSDPSISLFFFKKDKRNIDYCISDLDNLKFKFENEFYTLFDVNEFISKIDEIVPYFFIKRKGNEIMDPEETPEDNKMYIKKHLLSYFDMNEQSIQILKDNTVNDFEILLGCYGNIVNYENCAKDEWGLMVANHYKHILLNEYDKIMRKEFITDKDMKKFNELNEYFFNECFEHINHY